MAKSRGSVPAPDPPAKSEESGKEEEEVNGGTGSESDSESESESEEPKQTEPTKKPAQASSVKKPAQAAPPVKKPEIPKPSIPVTSSDEDDSGSDSPVTKPIANIKPIPSKPVVAATNASKTSNSKANGSVQALPTKSISAAGSKRPANSETGGGDGEGKDKKRLKKKPENYVEESEKKENSETGGGDGEGKDKKRLKKKPEKYVEESEKKENSETGGGDGERKNSKRVKKKPEKYVEESEKKGNSTNDSRKLFQRLWSEDDEIEILKGMVEYSAKKNADPVANLDDFHEFIKKSLHIDVSRAQLQDKIRRLRKKYTNNAGKEKNGKERIFAKDHEQKTFEWSRKVWGKENSVDEKKSESPYVLKSAIANTRKPKIEVQQVEVECNNKEGEISVSEDTRLEKGLKLGNMGLRNSGIEEWIGENCQFLDEEKRAKLEKKLKDFKIVEGEFYAKKLELMLEGTNLILDALKSAAT